MNAFSDEELQHWIGRLETRIEELTAMRNGIPEGRRGFVSGRLEEAQHWRRLMTYRQETHPLPHRLPTAPKKCEP